MTSRAGLTVLDFVEEPTGAPDGLQVGAGGC